MVARATSCIVIVRYRYTLQFIIILYYNGKVQTYHGA